MKIIIISDTHGDIRKAYSIISKNEDVNTIIHLGDIQSDVEELQYMFPLLKHLSVRGNSEFRSNVPIELFLELEGVRIFMTHGHRYNVKSGIDQLIAKALTNNYHLVLFGHTHKAFLKRINNCTFINPGSAAYGRGNGESYAVIKISNGKFDAKIIEV